jgi:DNA-binding transcriptional regulator YhcF (GntR family)
MFPVNAASLDKSLPIPVGQQLRGLLSYLLSHGDMAYGTRLPSVRQLAAELGIAPMTVAQVYRDLRDAGLIEMRRGLGAFTARDPHQRLAERTSMGALRSEIAGLIDRAERAGVTPAELAAMVTAQAQLRRPQAGLDLVFVGIFTGPTEDYVEEIRPLLSAGDTIAVTTIEQIRSSAEARRRCSAADLVLTFVHREAEVRAIVPAAQVLAIRFIPAQRTREALAALGPLTRIAAVSYFEEYVAIMRPSIREFAPHVADIQVTWISAPGLAAVIDRCDAIVYATGADAVARLARPRMACFEYRHAPDRAALHHVLLPYLSELRAGRPAKAAPPRRAAAKTMHPVSAS